MNKITINLYHTYMQVLPFSNNLLRVVSTPKFFKDPPPVCKDHYFRF